MHTAFVYYIIRWRSHNCPGPSIWMVAVNTEVGGIRKAVDMLSKPIITGMGFPLMIRAIQ